MLTTTREKPNVLNRVIPAGFLKYRTLWPWLIVLALTLLAFFMRRKGLATQSLWFDEADLVARAKGDVGTLLGDFLRPGENGPLYTLFMHFWMQIVGSGEAAVRTPSMIAGTLIVPVIYELGRKFLGGWQIGLVAATLVALSPYQLWYSQDAKMYPVALLLTLVSVYFFLTALQTNRKSWWVAYVILTTLSFYVHLMSVLIVGVEVGYYFLLKPEARGQRAEIRNQKSETSGLDATDLDGVATVKGKTGNRRALVALGLLTLPYLPIALWQARALWDGTIGETWFQPVGLFDMIDTLTRRFSVNRIDNWTLETTGAVVYAAIVLLGLFRIWRQPTTAIAAPLKKSRLWRFQTTNRTALLLTLYLVLPIVAFYILSTRVPLFADRYLLIASPAYYLLAAWGIVWLVRKVWPLALVSGAVIVVLSGVALFSFNYSETPQKEDWRGALHWLQGQLRDGDEIVVMPGYLETAVQYYLKPDPKIPVYPIPENLLDRSADRDLNGYLMAENGILRGHERVWLIVSPDRYAQDNPEQYVNSVWFKYNTWMFHDPQVFLGVNIYAYTPYQIPGTDADYFPRTPAGHTSIQFGSSLMLEGYDVLSTETAGPMLPAGQVRYDDNLHLTFYWRKIADDPTNYAMKVRLIDANGNDTGTDYAAEPLAGYYPTSQWKTGQAVRDYRDLYIHVPPGQYKVELTVYPKDQPQQLLSGFFIKDGQPTQPAIQKYQLSWPITVVGK